MSQPQAETVRFPGGAGHKLTGTLQRPPAGEPRHWAVFAHCFTCHRNYKVAAHVSRALALAGIGVLRFDFTGLGESAGTFADTDFTTHIADLLAAARYLEATRGAPELLVGHSLGGSAALFAAASLPSVKCVATISSSDRLERLARLFPADVRTRWAADPELVQEVVISGRPMPFKQRFLDSVAAHDGPAALKALGRPLLIFHSPVDQVTSFQRALDMYADAAEPKSLVSLGDADHLVSRRDDGEMIGRMTAAWAMRYFV
jgi:putative redox protein